jgi:glycosyltransferase involved in cell wall biosynthesis
MTTDRRRLLLFASIHCCLDPSSGAALATRDVLELLAARGWDCRALCCGVLDYEQETTLGEVLATVGQPAEPAAARLPGGRAVQVYDMRLGGVRITLLPVASSRGERSPSREEGAVFLELASRVLDRFRPEVLLTYGGHPANLRLMAEARRRGIAVVFHLHNFGYADCSAFADADAVLVPSEYAARYYRRQLGLECSVIPYPLPEARVVAENSDPRYVTFINPQPAKGVTVFARIAAELFRRRPDIPLLVVEGRGTSDWLARVPLDLSELTNLNRMANTPDPREFYRLTRVLLVPSLWRESFGRVAAEGLANGIPVLASDRGALPETLGEAGFAFTIPERCTPASAAVPTGGAVMPWLATIERLWDDADFEARHRALSKVEAQRWDSDRLAEQYEVLFQAIASRAYGIQEAGSASN